MMKFILVISFLLFVPLTGFAQFYDVESKGEYVLGDNDTKAEAKRIALEYAKRNATEMIGTYLESSTVVRNSKLESDEIRTYSSAILKINVISEDMHLLENKATIFSIRIKASVDTSVLESKIKELRVDTKRKHEIAKLQTENLTMLKELEELSKQLKNSKGDIYRKLREQREGIFSKLDSNQKVIKLTFEKGALLTLAMNNKENNEMYKAYIDDFFELYKSSLIISLSAPLINKSTNFPEHYSEVAIPLDFHTEETDRLIDLARKFNNNAVVRRGILDIKGKFLGVSENEIRKYWEQHKPIIRITVGDYSKDIELFYENNRNGNQKATNESNRLYLSNNTQVSFGQIPTSKLETISSINAEIIIDYKYQSALLTRVYDILKTVKGRIISYDPIAKYLVVSATFSSDDEACSIAAEVFNRICELDKNMILNVKSSKSGFVPSLINPMTYDWTSVLVGDKQSIANLDLNKLRGEINSEIKSRGIVISNSDINGQ